MKKIITTIMIFLSVGIIWIVYNTSKNTKENDEKNQKKLLSEASQRLAEESNKGSKKDSEEKSSESELSKEEAEEVQTDLQASVQLYSDWASVASSGGSPFPPPVVEEVDGGKQRLIHVGVRQWEWVPLKISAEYEEKIILIMHNADVAHSISIPDLDVKQDIPEDGAVVQFVASKRGTFTFLCDTPCGKDHDKMKAEITIT